jgi:hypothetical protein
VTGPDDHSQPHPVEAYMVPVDPMDMTICESCE